jgi:hypothetical protein
MLIYLLLSKKSIYKCQQVQTNQNEKDLSKILKFIPAFDDFLSVAMEE